MNDANSESSPTGTLQSKDNQFRRVVSFACISVNNHQKGLCEEKVNKIGKLLKEYRKRANLTQPQLAGASGVATSIVNDVENGIRNAGSKTLDRIARGSIFQMKRDLHLSWLACLFQSAIS